MARKPNMRRAVARYSEPVVMITRTEVTEENYEVTHSLKKRVINANVQVAQKRRLNPDTVNWSLKYRQIFSQQRVELGEFFIDEGIVFKVIDDGDWQKYGYTDAVGEQVKDSTLEPGDFVIVKA